MIAGRYDQRETQASALVAKMGTKPFSEEIEQEAIAAVGAALKATKHVRQRDAQGVLTYVEVPDHPLRAAVGIKIVEHNLGKPLQRSVVANLQSPGGHSSANSGDDLLNLLLAAPDAASDIVKKLQDAASRAKSVEPIEVSAKPALPEAPKAEN